MAVGSVSFLLLLHIAFGSQLTNQEDIKGSDNSATILINAYAQSDDLNLNDTSENSTGSGSNNNETVRATTARTFDNDNNSSTDADQFDSTSGLKEIRGFIGGMITEDSAGGIIIEEGENRTAQSMRGGEEYVVTGQWRVVANQSVLERFVANLTIARTDGMESHNIIMEDVGPNFHLNRNGNIMTSEFPVLIYRNNFNLTAISAPVQLELRGNNIMQFAITIGNDNTNSLPAGLQILELLDERPVYGTVRIVTVES
ncbi:MAG TPA: hypothetical protein VF172_06070 [Nitrososphaera sp.]